MSCELNAYANVTNIALLPPKCSILDYKV